MRRIELHLGAALAATLTFSGCGGRDLPGETGSATDGGETEASTGAETSASTTTEATTDSSGTGTSGTDSESDSAGTGTGTDTDGTSAGSTSTGGDTDDTSTGADTGELACAEICNGPIDGGCFSARDCLEVCETEGPSWPPELYGPFESCAQTNPLCFESLDGCMLSTLYPDTRFALHVTGSGFEAYEGATIRVWHDPDQAPFTGEGVIVGGAVELTFDEAVAVWDTMSSLVFTYVDADGDAKCEADVDIGGAFTPVWNGDWLDPVFEAALTPAELDNISFACTFQP
ncbi:MAG: hypothetical protein R3A79_14025 [Nannocystaceae bacterium]